MTSLDSAVRTFATAVSAAWPSVYSLAMSAQPSAPETFMDDWLQSMWESLVEAAATIECNRTVFIDIYGEGADCHPKSSRIYMPEKLPTHSVNCLGIGEAIIDALMKNAVELPSAGLPVEFFVRLNNSGWYEKVPPFDHVIVMLKNREVALPMNFIKFVLIPINNPTSSS